MKWMLEVKALSGITCRALQKQQRIVGHIYIYITDASLAMDSRDDLPKGEWFPDVIQSPRMVSIFTL